MLLTIPLLVPERVVDWAVSKGYLEFEVHSASGGEDDTPAHGELRQAGIRAPVAADDTGGGQAGQESDAEALDRRLVEAKTAGDSRDKAHQEQIGALSRELQRVSRHFTESQEYSTFLEGKLEEANTTIAKAASEICHLKALVKWHTSHTSQPTSSSSRSPSPPQLCFYSISPAPPSPASGAEMRRRVEAGAKQDDWQHRDECPSHREREEAVHAGWVVQPAAHPRGEAQVWAAEDRGEADKEGEGRPHSGRLAPTQPANQCHAEMKLWMQAGHADKRNAVVEQPPAPRAPLPTTPSLCKGLGQVAGSKMQMVMAISTALSSTAAVAFQVQDEGRRAASGETLEVPVACGLSRPACQAGPAPHAQGVPAHAAASDIQVGAWMFVQGPGQTGEAAGTEVERAAAAKREVTEEKLALGDSAQAECSAQSAVVESPRTPRDHSPLGCASSVLPPARPVNPGGGQVATDGAVAGARYGRTEMRQRALGIGSPRTPDGLSKGRTQTMEAGARQKGKRVALRALQLDSGSGLSPGPRPLISL